MIVGALVIAEAAKLRRARITWLSWLALSLIPLVSALFMWIAREPARASSLGLLGKKAAVLRLSADWPGFLSLLTQAIGLGGMILVAVIGAFVFGREYADGTAKNLLTLPIERHWFALAKLLVVLAWALALTASFLVESLALAYWLGLPGYSGRLVVGAIGDIVLVACLAWALVPTVAWVAILGRGYFAPLAFTILTFMLGNVLGATGWGRWFPWSIVPLYAGVSGPRAEALASSSLLVVCLTFVAGSVATILHLRRADNTQ
jgi:ABC-2 type transport system permease protein